MVAVRGLVRWVVALALAVAGSWGVASRPSAAEGSCVVVENSQGVRLYLGTPSPAASRAMAALADLAARRSDGVAGVDWCSTQTAIEIYLVTGRADLATRAAEIGRRHGVPVFVGYVPYSIGALLDATGRASATLDETALGITRMVANPARSGIDVYLKQNIDVAIVPRLEQITLAASVPVFIHLDSESAGVAPPEDSRVLSASSTRPCANTEDELGQRVFFGEATASSVVLGQRLSDLTAAHPTEIFAVSACSNFAGFDIWLTSAARGVRAQIARLASQSPGQQLVVHDTTLSGDSVQLWATTRPPTVGRSGIVQSTLVPARLGVVALMDSDSPSLLKDATAVTAAWQGSIPLTLRAIPWWGSGGQVSVALAVPAEAASPSPPALQVAVDDPRVAGLALLACALVVWGVGLARRAHAGDDSDEAYEMNELESWSEGFVD